MKIIEINNLNELDNIKENYYSIIFISKKEKNKIPLLTQTVKIFGKNKYENFIYLIDNSLIKNNIEFKDINIFPSLFLFRKDKENPDYFIPGYFNIKKLNENLNNIKKMEIQ